MLGSEHRTALRCAALACALVALADPARGDDRDAGSAVVASEASRPPPAPLDAGVPAPTPASLAEDARARPSPARALDGGALDSALPSNEGALLAQQPNDVSDAGGTRVPPRVLFLPALALEPEAGVIGSLEAIVLVGRDGDAQLAECTHGALACGAIARALAQARLLPAERDGVPTAARVRLRFAPPTLPALLTQPDAGVAATRGLDASAPLDERTADDEYGAVARVANTPPSAHGLELAELRELPGAFGDPYRALESLPGVVPVLSGLPYVYVRGAPPAATAYFYDDVQLPALFHLALGPAVVHPAMIGAIDFYPGVAPARYGRKTGGVVTGQAAAKRAAAGVHGELELRLVDLQAYVSAPLPRGGHVELAGRYGYPGLLTKFFEPSAVFSYWDYQLRASKRVHGDTELSLVVLGSYDLVGERKKRRVERELELQFHRLEARAVTRRRGLRIGYALGGGIERSGFSDDFEVTAVRLGPRVWLETRIGRAKLRFGADMLASFGELANPLDDDEDERRRMRERAQRAGVMVSDELEGARDSVYATATTRNVVGAYGELDLQLAPRLRLEAGLRGDVWITGGDAQAALEPRLLVRHELHPRVRLHAALGLAYQPSVFLVPLPGIADVALDRGLQRAVQSELGAGFELPASLQAETKLYAHFYDNMLSFEALEENDACFPGAEGCAEEDEIARMSAYSYGVELLLRRAFRERVAGWLAYTLSWADGKTARGRDLTPNFDVRHIANLVLQWRISARWHAALRGFAQSGRFPFGAGTSPDPRDRVRLPPFFRGDLQVSRLWQRRWGELRLTLDWLNFTFQREPLRWSCETMFNPETAEIVRTGGGPCKVEYVSFPITLPMLGVRGTY